VYSHPADSWDRAYRGHGHRCRLRQRRSLPEGTRLCCVPRRRSTVPRQYSTGGKARLLGISKRGNVYLRKILIHGARAAVLRIKRDRAPIGAWLDALDARAPKNVVVVAMANKLARIAWAVLRPVHRSERNGVACHFGCTGSLRSYRISAAHCISGTRRRVRTFDSRPLADCPLLISILSFTALLAYRIRSSRRIPNGWWRRGLRAAMCRSFE
jgi:hypothetical protein